MTMAGLINCTLIQKIIIYLLLRRLLEFCELSNPVVANTPPPPFHKGIHLKKKNWNSSDFITKVLIDHFCVIRKFSSSVRDAIAYRGSDIGSDHSLCIAKLTMKLRSFKRPHLLLTDDTQIACSKAILNCYTA